MHIAPLVVCLVSDEVRDITGRVFHAMGGRIDLMDGWSIAGIIKKSKEEWAVEELPEKIKGLIEGVEVGDMTMKISQYFE
jgi:hypothetical protein